MSPEVWQRVNRIFGDALEVPPEIRPGFIRNAADGDPAVEAEVLRLLEALDSTGGFLETPAVDLNGLLPPASPHAGPLLTPGVLLCKRFEITRFLASGGMGEVYEAWDNVLREAVALKTIRPHIAQRAEIIERFRQEVRNARALSHPNICRVHELFSDEIETGADTGSHPAMPPTTQPGQKTWFLSMELLGGTTLLECIRQKGKLPPNDALDFARQLALGLEAAHTHGLVHRDFKSANVMLMYDGDNPTRAVIMDFGLSLRTLKDPNQPTEHSAAGGTSGYMAPEQATGGEVGPLADQYAFGVVLCEMLTGQLPRTKPGAAVSGKQRMQLPAHHFPPRCEHVLRRCLERDPLCRFPDVKTAARTLLPPGLLGTPWRIAAALLFVTALAGGLWKYREYRNRCFICDVVQLTPDTDQSESPSLSRDGKTIAYSSDRAESGNLDIFVQHLPDGQPIRLTTNQSRDSDPSISADGSMVAFRSERDGGGIYRKNVAGGAETLLMPGGRSPQISPDMRTLVFWKGDPDSDVASGKIFQMSLGPNGSADKPARLASDFQMARYPMWSPDGKAVLFTGCRTAADKLPGCIDWWVTNLSGTRMVQTHAMQALGNSDVLLSRPVSGFWSGDEVLFSGKSGTQQALWSLALNSRTWQVSGKPQRILHENARDLGPNVAGNSTIAYTRTSGALHVWRISNIAARKDPELTKISDDAEVDNTPFISDDGQYLSFARGRSANRPVLIRHMPDGTDTPVPGVQGLIFSPIVDNTGGWLAYAQDDHGATSIYAGERGGKMKRVCSGCGHPTSWFDTNRGFFYRSGVPSQISLADQRTGVPGVTIAKSNASLDDASWSPANEMLLFSEMKDDKRRIFAVSFPRASRKPEGLWIELPATTGAPDHPRWSADGRTVFYTSDQDGSICVYGQTFSPENRQFVGTPFTVTHFHHGRASISNVLSRSFNLTVGGGSLYLNLGEQSSTIQMGRRPDVDSLRIFSLHPNNIAVDSTR